MTEQSPFKIKVFHCINVFPVGDPVRLDKNGTLHLEFVKMPCSSMVKDVFLLRAFEAGADAVAVMVCPEGTCRYVEGNLRARKRVRWVKGLLDEIGLGSGRLEFFNVSSDHWEAGEAGIQDLSNRLATLGSNPAAPNAT